MTNASQSLITVTANGKSLGIFDSRSGGESTVAINQYYAGGRQTADLDAGRPTTGDVTVARRFDAKRDNEVETDLRANIHRTEIVVTEQLLDDDGVAFLKPRVWTGKLNSVDTGGSDSNSDDLRMLTIVMTAKSVK